MKFSKKVMPMRVTSTPYFDRSKMADVEPSEVDAKLASVSVGP